MATTDSGITYEFKTVADPVKPRVESKPLSLSEAVEKLPTRYMRQEARRELLEQDQREKVVSPIYGKDHRPEAKTEGKTRKTPLVKRVAAFREPITQSAGSEEPGGEGTKAVPFRKQDALPPYRSTEWAADENIRLLQRYFGLVDLTNQQGQQLEKIIDYGVRQKGVRSQRGLLHWVRRVEESLPRGFPGKSPFDLVTRGVMLGL